MSGTAGGAAHRLKIVLKHQFRSKTKENEPI